MHTLLHSVPWVHIAPAILAVVFALFYLETKQIYLKIVFGILWLLLIPNTAYIFTDIERISLHWNSINIIMRIVLIIQYIFLEIIGLITFLLAMIPFESMIHGIHLSKKKQIIAIILFNFLIGFGIVLGRTDYTNSYVIFVQPIKVFLAAINIFIFFELLVLVVFWGILCNCIYFLFRKTLQRYAKKLL